MNNLLDLKYLVLTICLATSLNVVSQINPGIYISDIENVRHELKMTDNYMIHTIYEQSPARFIKTEGGFYNIEDSVLNVKLEFNSNYEADTISTLTIPFAIRDGQLILGTEPRLVFNHFESIEQELDGQWLFAMRGPDEGQERRGDENPRKTLKYLQDNRFQWIAYNKEERQFIETKGGEYKTDGDQYTEEFHFYSENEEHVGTSQTFNFEMNDGIWKKRISTTTQSEKDEHEKWSK